MERCDFVSVMAVIRSHVSEDWGLNQIDFLYLIFNSFISSEAGMDFDFDNGLVCRWLKGSAKVSPKISGYYLTDKRHRIQMATDIYENLLPKMSDSAMAVEKIYGLIIGDDSISERMKSELVQKYPCHNEKEDAAFFTNALCFGLEREFVKRDAHTNNLIASGNLSPAVSDFIFGNDVPNPCRYFCGREQELEQLHEMLLKHGKVFLQGIAGVGKSELAKAYARQHKKEYTNTLYMIYSGDLHQDVIDLDFADDLPGDSEEERFRKHNRFLRSLKSDTLLIVDNFNATATKDSFLPVVMKYRCRVLFTTRSRMENYPTMQLSEISNKMTLLELMGRYYSSAKEQESVLSEIIDTVHSHTLAVELAARLLEHGLLQPHELLRKLQEEKVALDDADKISITKDGKPAKETYYGHIHTLFSLYLLTGEYQGIMRNMVMVPVNGVPLRRLADWLSLSDLNTVNDLIEMGFITPLPGHCVSLHPMIQETSLADLKPSITNCRVLLENLHSICLFHGREVSYYKVIFQTIENIIHFIEKDELPFYLRFLEDAFSYMEKYQYEQGMQLIIQELKTFLNQPSVGTARDRALLLDCQATCEKNREKAVKLEKDALALLPEVDEDNALLVSNLHANLGGMYREMKKYDLARQHMESGIEILERQCPVYIHDIIPQSTNYAIFLSERGEAERGMAALQKLTRYIKDYGAEVSEDFAAVQEAMGGICLKQGRISEASEHFKKATGIYEIIWEDSPEQVEAKYQEIGELYPQAGIGLAQKFLSQR
ncbi:MAG: tetratricopeptide repeat protein [Lachnospiraceae bacterium]|nr:tetratricopeptide repeat protein [Lachnospiraceae bacterium]